MKSKVWILAAAIACLPGPPASGQVQPLWVYDAGAVVTGAPSLASDGTIYIGVPSGVQAVTNWQSTVSNKWVFPVPYSGRVLSPAVGNGGTLYIAAGDLFALSPDGTQKWRYQLLRAWGTPALTADGTILVDTDGYLQAISSGAQSKWQRALGTLGISAASLGRDGSIFFPAFDERALYAFRQDGTQIWRSPVAYPSLISTFCAAGADGPYILAGGLYAYSAAGDLLWTNLSVNNNVGCPTIAGDGSILVASGSSFGFSYGLVVHCLNQNGGVKWVLATNLMASPRLAVGSPAVDQSGNLYVTAANYLFAISADGAVLWSFDAGLSSAEPEFNTSPTIGPGGTLYVTFGTRLFAFRGGAPLANSPWPMYRQNPRHTGKVEGPSLQRPQKRVDSNFEFQLFGQISNTFSVEASTNLVDWAAITSFVATTVPVDVADLDASNYPVRFYRAVEASSASRKKGGR